MRCGNNGNSLYVPSHTIDDSSVVYCLVTGEHRVVALFTVSTRIGAYIVGMFMNVAFEIGLNVYDTSSYPSLIQF